MSMTIKTIQQDLVDVQGHLEDGDIEGAKDIFSKLKDDVTEVLESLDILLSDVKKNKNKAAKQTDQSKT